MDRMGSFRYGNGIWDIFKVISLAFRRTRHGERALSGDIQLERLMHMIHFGFQDILT
jgi:hypothetical protein